VTRAKRKGRTLVLLLVEANDPDDIDGSGFEERRRNGLGWEELPLLHPGAPDLLVRKAFDLDLGVYGSPREWDPDEKCVVQTYFIAPPDVKSAARALSRHAAKAEAFATRVIEHASSGEDPKRVAAALTEESKTEARGPAEEAAAYVRIFLAHHETAVKFKHGIAWELRTPAKCRCQADEGTSPGSKRLDDFFYRTLKPSAAGERVQCRECKTKFVVTRDRLSTTVTRETEERRAPAKKRV
jgi:hypothetical protein